MNAAPAHAALQPQSTIPVAHPARFALYAPPDLDSFLPASDWAIYHAAVKAAQSLAIPHAIGGGLAVSFYTGLWRSTKDFDLYVLPEHRQALIDALLGVGMVDYYPQKHYDRAWIFRATQAGVIIDVIWAMANRADVVSPSWLATEVHAVLPGATLPVLAPEYLLWSKIHVLQRDRCDWPDLLNLIHVAGPRMDWPLTLRLLGDHAPLLAGLLAVYSWIAPGRAAQLPRMLWSTLGLSVPQGGGDILDLGHVRMIDSCPWFTQAPLA